MGDIKHLPEAIRNSVRSASILFDLTRVVEELIFNSLDAGATKISVAVGAETGYLKVVDNGYGITRDNLVLLAKRYATSKFDQLADSHAGPQSFGFRGEALSSIANVSLLEVLTKAHGRPNGYRKVMKGCNCLYLGIDDGRQDVGTTVIIRDLFYNQPVRRKLIQSSTKRELESVKKCVLRISLIHPKVSFKVVDIESDDEFFSASPSSSLLSRLMSFGVEVANSLHELNITDGTLKLSGYLSCPTDSSSVKTFQYIYINSRYISKGTIHKLLNQLASSFNSLQLQKVNVVSQIAKRSRTQICSTFILNLCCPRSWYDITFEPSKTSVDFKDWKGIVDFIEKAVTRFWNEFFSHEDSLSDRTGMHVLSDNVEIGSAHAYSPGENSPAKFRTDKRRRRIQNHTSPTAYPSPSTEIQCQKYEHWDCLKRDTISSHDITYPSGSSFKPLNESPAISWAAIDQEIGSCGWEDDYRVYSTKDNLVANKSFAPEKYKMQKYYTSKSSFGEEDFKVDVSLVKGHFKTDISSDSFDFENPNNVINTFEKPFLQSCTSWKRRDFDERPLKRSEGLDTSPTKEYLESNLHSDPFGIGNVVSEKPFLQSCTSRKSRVLDEESLLRSEGLDRPIESLRCRRTCNRNNELKFSLRSPVNSFLSGGNFGRENDIRVKTDYDLDDSLWRAYESRAKYDYLEEREKVDLNFHFDDIVWSTSSQEHCSSISGVDTCVDFQKYARTEEDSSDMFTDVTKWLSPDLYGKYDVNSCAFTSHHKVDKDKDQRPMKENIGKPRPKRSHSAPPFCRGKRKSFALNINVAAETKKTKNQSVDDPEAGKSKHSNNSSDVCPESNSVEDLLFDIRESKNGLGTCGIKKAKMKEKMEDLQFNCIAPMEDIQDPVVPELKWRQGCPKTANGDKSHNPQNDDTILNISSDLFLLAGDLLVPESLNKNFLKDAKVLQQVDKKFIPVVGNGVLAIIDQHAADERIRLEELRQKVLSGEKKTITYLDVRQKLVMPEFGHQLLHSYAEQIQNWGWLCDFHSQDSKSFKKNLNILHKQPRGITLTAVPCILGVNLTDVDLLEYLQQLADTDGSSTIPPSVVRVLNSKSCRGAIMFGDTLLPSECSLIVEELKQTSLCFQCAHGRPTTVPLINLEALHKQIEKFKSWNASSNTWHGLRRHIPSLERVANRLSTTKV